MTYEISTQADRIAVQAGLQIGPNYGTFVTRAAIVAALSAAGITPVVGATAWVGTGAPFTLLYWNGAAWYAPTQAISQSAVAVPLTGTTVATVLATVPIPGGIMGPNGALRVTADYTMTNNANNKRFIARWGLGSINFFNINIASQAQVRLEAMIYNRGAVGSQLLAPGEQTAGTYGALGAVTPVTASENTDADSRIQFLGTLTTSTDTITLESYSIELVG